MVLAFLANIMVFADNSMLLPPGDIKTVIRGYRFIKIPVRCDSYNKTQRWDIPTVLINRHWTLGRSCPYRVILGN